ncbi:MAG: hypothetical protein V2A77_04555 [Pseudomonadota bacterium]
MFQDDRPRPGLDPEEERRREELDRFLADIEAPEWSPRELDQSDQPAGPEVPSRGQGVEAWMPQGSQEAKIGTVDRPRLPETVTVLIDGQEREIPVEALTIAYRRHAPLKRKWRGVIDSLKIVGLSENAIAYLPLLLAKGMEAVGSRQAFHSLGRGQEHVSPVGPQDLLGLPEGDLKDLQTANPKLYQAHMGLASRMAELINTRREDQRRMALQEAQRAAAGHQEAQHRTMAAAVDSYKRFCESVPELSFHTPGSAGKRDAFAGFIDEYFHLRPSQINERSLAFAYKAFTADEREAAERARSQRAAQEAGMFGEGGSSRRGQRRMSPKEKELAEMFS